jgi:hypothetical protein
MRLTIVTPVGPGHEAAVLNCKESARRAWAHSHGPFARYRHAVIDDTAGRLGRSAARNRGVAETVAWTGRDGWFFFVDADDALRVDAFDHLAWALAVDPKLDAVFGSVHTDVNGTLPDNVHPLDFDGVLRIGPKGTLSMGCFVRQAAAEAVKFNEGMDAAEDFDWFLRLLHGRRWTKLRRPLVTIGQSIPSAVGPRGYVTLDWLAACQAVIDKWKAVRPTAR